MAVTSPRRKAGSSRRSSGGERRELAPAWTFLTNHSHVLLCIAKEPEVRMRDIALVVGITERAVQRIVSDLEEAGYIARIRHGRRNRYEVRGDLPLRHPVERHEKVSSLIALVHRKAGRRPQDSREVTSARGICAPMDCRTST